MNNAEQTKNKNLAKSEIHFQNGIFTWSHVKNTIPFVFIITKWTQSRCFLLFFLFTLNQKIDESNDNRMHSLKSTDWSLNFNLQYLNNKMSAEENKKQWRARNRKIILVDFAWSCEIPFEFIFVQSHSIFMVFRIMQIQTKVDSVYWNLKRNTFEMKRKLKLKREREDPTTAKQNDFQLCENVDVQRQIIESHVVLNCVHNKSVINDVHRKCPVVTVWW